MILTRGKSKKREHSEERNRTYQHYNKILLIISSCKTADQFKVVNRIISNFETYCIKKGVSYDTYSMLASYLKECLEYKARRT
jgi:hypothetical protein